MQDAGFRSIAAAFDGDFKIIFAQVFSGQVSKARIVFDQQDSCFHGVIIMGCGLRRNATGQYTSSGSLRAKAVECRACFVFAFDAARWPIHAPSRALLWKAHAGRLVALEAFELLLELVERHQEVDKPFLLGLDDLHRGARDEAFVAELGVGFDDLAFKTADFLG